VGVSDDVIPGIFDMGVTKEHRQGATRATITENIKIETDSNISGLNRDSSRLHERGQAERSHWRIALPLVNTQKLSESFAEAHDILSGRKKASYQELKQAVARLEEEISEQEAIFEEVLEEEQNQASFPEQEQASNQSAEQQEQSPNQDRNLEPEAAPEAEIKHSIFTLGEEAEGQTEIELFSIGSQEAQPTLDKASLKVCEGNSNPELGSTTVVMENGNGQKVGIKTSDKSLERIAQLYQEAVRESVNCQPPICANYIDSSKDRDIDTEPVVSALLTVAEAYPQLKALALGLPKVQAARDYSSRLKEVFFVKVSPYLRAISQNKFIKCAGEFFRATADKGSKMLIQAYSKVASLWQTGKIPKAGDPIGNLGILIENPGVKLRWDVAREHALNRMTQRGITVETFELWVKNGKAIQKDTNTYMFITKEGVAITSMDGVPQTAYSAQQFKDHIKAAIKQLYRE
jgi:hypothetical protein